MTEAGSELCGRRNRYHRDNRIRLARPGTVTIEQPTVYQTAI